MGRRRQVARRTWVRRRLLSARRSCQFFRWIRFWCIGLVLTRGDPTFERDGEFVECRLPPCCPSWSSCPGCSARVARNRHLIPACSLGECPRARISRVDQLDRVNTTDDSPDFRVVVEERHEPAPGAAPQPDDRRVSRAPVGDELVEPLLRRGLDGCGADRPQFPRHLVPTAA